MQLAHILADESVTGGVSVLGFATQIHCLSCAEVVLCLKVNFVGAYTYCNHSCLKIELFSPKKNILNSATPLVLTAVFSFSEQTD